MGVPSLNDLAVDGTLNTTNQPTNQPYQNQLSVRCMEDRGRISRSGLTRDIKMGSCVFQCDVPHHRIAQRQVVPVSVYCDGVGCRFLCLRHGIPVC